MFSNKRESENEICRKAEAYIFDNIALKRIVVDRYINKTVSIFFFQVFNYYINICGKKKGQ